jgi:hypothetical protein
MSRESQISLNCIAKAIECVYFAFLIVSSLIGQPTYKYGFQTNPIKCIKFVRAK